MAGAGDGDARGRRRGCRARAPRRNRVATDMGASQYVALYRTRLAHVLVAQGRDDDALAELEQARQTSTGTRRHGRPPGRACSRVAARRRRRSRSPAKQSPPWTGATTSPRTPRSSSTSPRCCARTATSSAPAMLLTRRSPCTRRRETSCPRSSAAAAGDNRSRRPGGSPQVIVLRAAEGQRTPTIEGHQTHRQLSA